MEKIEAGAVKLPRTSLVWNLLEGLVEAFTDEIHDMAPLDVQWLLEQLEDYKKGLDDDKKAKKQRDKLARALDAEPECAGWRGVHLLYLWPAW